ncbi:unnamed protein product, partial [Effrenium voratum]
MLRYSPVALRRARDWKLKPLRRVAWGEDCISLTGISAMSTSKRAFAATEFDAAQALHTTPKDYQGAQELYDNWAASYDDTLRGWGYDAHEKCTELVVKHLAANGRDPKEVVLMDCGCGTGMAGEELVKRHVGRLRIGMDASKESLVLSSKKAIEFAKEGPVLVSAAASDADFADMNAKRDGEVSTAEAQTDSGSSCQPLYHRLMLGNLDKPFHHFDDGSLDVVMCVGTTSYVTDFRNLFSEWHRILRPGGLVVFTHRTTIWDENEHGVITAAAELESAKVWRQLYKSEASAYMPKNTVPEEAAKQRLGGCGAFVSDGRLLVHPRIDFGAWAKLSQIDSIAEERVEQIVTRKMIPELFRWMKYMNDFREAEFNQHLQLLGQELAKQEALEKEDEDSEPVVDLEKVRLKNRAENAEMEVDTLRQKLQEAQVAQDALTKLLTDRRAEIPHEFRAARDGASSLEGRDGITSEDVSFFASESPLPSKEPPSLEDV